MKTSTIIVLTALAVLLIVSSTDARRRVYDDEDDEELSDTETRTLLRSMLEDNAADLLHLDQRKLKPGCVRCAFGIFKCCEPHICVRRRILPNKCLRIKVAQ